MASNIKLLNSANKNAMKLTRTGQQPQIQSLLYIPLFLLILLAIMPVSLATAREQRISELSDNTVLVVNSGLIWQQKRTGKIQNFTTMNNYVAKSKIEGWRLPTKQELYELIEIFDLHQNGVINMDIEGSYWLIDDNGTTVTGAWETGDQCGPSRSYYPHKRGHIRLVRTR